jgi:transposase
MTVFPTAAHLVSWARWSPQVQTVSRGKQRQQRHRPRQPLPGRRPRRSHHQRQPHPILPRREIPAADPANSQKKALVATGNSILATIHALLSGPEASYTDFGPGYYEQRTHVHRQARNHLKGLQRLGYNVTIQSINPDTGEILAPAG